MSFRLIALSCMVATGLGGAALAQVNFKPQAFNVRPTALNAVRTPPALAPAKRALRVKALTPNSGTVAGPSVQVTYKATVSPDNKLWMMAKAQYDGAPLSGGFYLIQPGDYAGVGAILAPGKAYVADFYVFPSSGTLTISGTRYGAGAPDAKFSSDVPVIDGHALVIVPATAATQLTAVAVGKGGGSVAAVLAVELTPLG